MEDPLEYDLLPIPRELTHRIVLACRKDISVKQLGNVCLLNKTWKAAIESGVFGPHGRLMCSQKSTRFALLVGLPCGENWHRLCLAVGLLDERCKNLYICPEPSSRYLDLILKPDRSDRGIQVSLLNRTIHILEEDSNETLQRLNPKSNFSRHINVHSFQSGEWTTECFGEEDRDPSLGLFETRFSFTGEDRIFYVGKDLSRPEGFERVLFYEPRTKHWSLLPSIVEQDGSQRVTEPGYSYYFSDGTQRATKPKYCYYLSEGSLHAFLIAGEAEHWSSICNADYTSCKWVVERNPRFCYYPLDGSQPSWKEEECDKDVRDLLAKHESSKSFIEPSSLRLCKRDGLKALLVSQSDASEKWVARERPVPAPPGEKSFRQLSFRKFQLKESVTGVIPVTHLEGAGELVMGLTSAVVLMDGKPQKAVKLCWRGELESRKFQIFWASAFPADGAKGESKREEASGDCSNG